MLQALLLTAFGVVAGSQQPPSSVVIDARGNVYFSDLAQVWRVAPDGSMTIAVPNVRAPELYLDPEGNLFGQDVWFEGVRQNKWGHYVWKRDAAGQVTIIKPATEGFLKDYSFVRDDAGNMYWPQHEKGEIRRRAPDGTITRVVGELRQVRSMHSTPGGTLYVIDGSDVVRVKNGRATRFAHDVVKSSAMRLISSLPHAVMGMWTDRAENVYFADYANGEVKRVTPSGEVSKYAQSTAPWAPVGGAFAANGDLWLLEASEKNGVRLRKIGATKR